MVIPTTGLPTFEEPFSFPAGDDLVEQPLLGSPVVQVVVDHLVTECGARDVMFEPTGEPPHGIPHNPFQPHDPQSGEILGPGGSGCIEND